MSPEQARGDIHLLGPATDVYGLGAILYYLLTGRAPVPGSDQVDVLDRVRRGEIDRPRSLNPRIDPALEAICLKALALEAEDRYPSAEALSEDIKKYLADEAVSARRDPPWVRAWRWMRRHRTFTTTAAAALLLTAVGLGIGYAREMRYSTNLAAASAETERRLDQVMKSYEEYFTGINEQTLKGQKLPKELLESLLEKPRRFYEQLTAELAGKPNPSFKERAVLSRGRQSLGRILAILGRHAEARGQLEAAAAIREALVRAQPGVPEYQDDLAGSHNNLGIVLDATGRADEAIAAHREAIATYEALVKTQPSQPGFRSMLGGALNNQGMTLARLGRHEEAIAHYRAAIEQQRSVFDRLPQVTQFRRFLSNHYSNLARSHRALGRAAEAAEATHERIKLWPGQPAELYNAACEFSLCVPIAPGPAEAETCAAEAIAALRQAIAAGWSDGIWSCQDPDLAPLRDRPDFQALVLPLLDRAFPKEPFAR